MISKERLYDMMRLRLLTISELSRQSGVARYQITKMLKGRDNTPTLKCVKRLAHVLKCTPGWLLRYPNLNEKEEEDEGT